jgi:hypothetical protein
VQQSGHRHLQMMPLEAGNRARGTVGRVEQALQRFQHGER